MRKRIRKPLSLLLAAALLLSLGLGALAEDASEALGETPPPATAAESEAPVTEDSREPPSLSPEAESEAPAEASEEGGFVADAAVLDAGALSAADYREFYLANYGSDENDGGYDAPLLTLRRAAELANGAPEDLVYLILLTDLESRETARFYEKEIVLMSDGETRRISRGADFAPVWDARRGGYNPALLECGRTEGVGLRGARLTIENVILDDLGAHEGELFREIPAGEDGTQYVQDGIVAAYDGGSAIVLGPGTQLLNYGGLSAVYLSGNASLVMEDYSGIRDTLALSRFDGMSAVLLHDAAGAVFGDYAAVCERALTEPEAASAAEDPPETEDTTDTEIPEAEASETEIPETETPEAEAEASPEANAEAGLLFAPEPGRAAEDPAGEAPETLPDRDGDGEAGAPAEEEAEREGSAPLAASPLEETLAELVGLRFTGPAGVALDESSEAYPVPYRLSLRLSDAEKAMILALGTVLRESGGTLVFRFDSRLDLSGTVESLRFDSELFATESSELTEDALTLHLRLGDGWAEALLQSEDALSLTLETSLPRSELEAGIGETMLSTAEASLNILTSSDSLILNAPPLDAPTRLLGPVSAVVLYDLNSGEGTALREEVSAQRDYPLNTEDTPTHIDVDGKPVVFLGWTLERDSRIYARGESAPATVESIDVAENSENTVYAVYGYDENEDGVPDVTQRLIALSYDANGGAGAPETAYKEADLLGLAHFEISPVEPTRPFHRFLGWAEEASADTAQYKYDAPREADRDLLLSGDMTLYAVWKENPSYTLSYNANGGSGAPGPQTGVSDERGVVQMTISTVKPTRPNYSFLGWGTSRSAAATYFPGEAVQISNGNVTLYAIWQRSSSGSYSGGGVPGGGTQSAPRTGDYSRPLLYLTLALFSLAAIAAAVVLLLRGKKRGKKR